MNDDQDEVEERAKAEATLDSSLHPIFEQLVDDFAVSAKIHAGQVVIDYV